MLEEATAAIRTSCDDVAARFALELAQSGLMYADGDFVGSAPDGGDALCEPVFVPATTPGATSPTSGAAIVLTMVDRLDESLQMSTEGVASAQRDRQGWALSIFETGRGRQLLQMGRLADAAAALEGQLTVDMAPQIVSVLDAAGVVALGTRRHTHGRPGPVSAGPGDGPGDARPERPERTSSRRLAARVAGNGRRRRPARAHERLRALGEDERMGIVPLFPMDVADEARLIHIALAAQDDELAAHAADAAQRRAELNPQIRSVAAAAAHARGLLDHNLKDLAEAAALYEGGPRPLAYAAALEDLGVATVEEGDTKEAVEVFGRSLELYAQVGAAWDAGRVRGRLRALGVRRRLVAAQRPGRGWAAMTDSELAVARLVAQGLTNREVAERLFVSQHTVSGHLRHVFAKLDVNSRVELTRLAGVHDPPP